MGILVNVTFDEVTPESAAAGDFSDSGFVEENTELSFRELVEKLRECSEWSDSGGTGNSREWGTAYCGTDYSTGTERRESIHFSRDNLPRVAKYWRKAAILAGHVRA